jgi:hypothetical protein
MGKVKPGFQQEADMPATILTVGQAARRAGLTAKAVRLYEARGLLPPAERTSSGYRCYTEHDIRLLRFIRQARDLGQPGRSPHDHRPPPRRGAARP